MKYTFKDYAHDDCETEEAVEHLTSDGWDEDHAREYARRHKPLYEVEARLEYDTESHQLRVLGAVIDGVHLVPA